MNIHPHIDRHIPRSRIRNWCIGEATGHARVIVVKPRDLGTWTDGINKMVKTVEACLINSGFIIVNDEGDEHGKQHGQVPQRNG